MSFCKACRLRHVAFGAFLATITIVLAGCASDIMKNYIGQPVELVILDYGPPTTIVDLDQSQRRAERAWA